MAFVEPALVILLPWLRLYAFTPMKTTFSLSIGRNYLLYEIFGLVLLNPCVTDSCCISSVSRFHRNSWEKHFLLEPTRVAMKAYQEMGSNAWRAFETQPRGQEFHFPYFMLHFIFHEKDKNKYSIDQNNNSWAGKLSSEFLYLHLYLPNSFQVFCRCAMKIQTRSFWNAGLSTIVFRPLVIIHEVMLLPLPTYSSMVLMWLLTACYLCSHFSAAF